MAVSPAGVLTSTAAITHEATVFFDRVALENVKKELRFHELTEPKRLPTRSGLVSQMFRYTPFAANTTAGTQGTIGTSITPSTETVSATIAQYFDFVNFSDLYLETIIDDSLVNVAAELGYRAGLTVDTLIRTEFDAGSATTSTALVGANLTAADYRKMVFLLKGNEVRPKVGSDFASLGHPFVLYDLVADTAAGGFIDITKYADSSVSRLFEGDELGKISGVRIGSSTNVGTSGTGATTKYWVYVVGAGAVASINLGEGDIGGERNPQISVMKHSRSASDPAGVIGGSCAYNFKFVAKRLLTTGDQERYRQVAADSTIAS
jgi:N4-gp56 family major capsid protein